MAHFLLLLPSRLTVIGIFPALTVSRGVVRVEEYEASESESDETVIEVTGVLVSTENRSG